MILSKFVNDEEDPAYRALSSDNLIRQYDFLRSIVNAAISIKHKKISMEIIKALNFHAISCLHDNAGEYRPRGVTVNGYKPPQHDQVPALMDEFIKDVNQAWDEVDVFTLSAYCLWKLNSIHPFVNGNGRTSRVLCYFVVCVKSGGWLPGQPILPELILRERNEYVELLKTADVAFVENHSPFLYDLSVFICRLLGEQFQSVSSSSREL